MAAWGHRRQRDKAGRRYIFHLVRVAWIAYGLTGDPEALVVGLLHDYFEDVESIQTGTLGERFGHRNDTQILTLTRPSLQHSYESYIDRIANCGDRIVVAVKIADLLHNTDPSRGDGVAPARMLKYLEALRTLTVKRAGSERG